jgi:hypothetical protein
MTNMNQRLDSAEADEYEEEDDDQICDFELEVSSFADEYEMAARIRRNKRAAELENQ